MFQTQQPDWWQQTFPEGRKTLMIEAATGESVAIAYSEMGAGKPLFLLHGIGSWSYSWRYCIKPLAQHYRVICVDATGNGFSQKLTEPGPPGHQLVELEQIIRALSLEPAIAVGESLGALTALGVAQNAPSLIEQLVLINIPIFPKQLPSLGMRLLANLPLDLVRWFDEAGAVQTIAPLVRILTYLARREVVADPNSITDEDVYWLTYPYIYLPGSTTRFAADLQQATGEIQKYLQNQPNLISKIQDQISRVTCPTLVLWGDRDQWFPVEDGQRLRDRLPAAEFGVLPNCGHNASASNPADLTDAILDFLGHHFYHERSD
jgi:pimeloyl-ACP methyl ester carboxylesterase